MTPRLLSSLVLAAFSLASQAVAAQTPGSVVNGRVAVRVFVSLSDSTTRYYPLIGHRLFFYRSANDSTIAATDSTGSLTVLLPPGDYRVISAKPVGWHGFNYSWNVLVSVKPGMPIVDLRSPEATSASSAALAAAGASSDIRAAPTITRQSSDTGIVYYRTVAVGAKDPSTAFLWSFLIAGGGQIYAGETGKGVALLVTSSLGAVVTLDAIEADASCNSGPFGSSGCSDAGVVQAGKIAAVVWLGTWIYSMADAGGAARRWNDKHGLATVSLAPTTHRTVRGTSLGLAFSLKR